MDDYLNKNKKKKKDKAKDNFNKYGKFTQKNVRIKEALAEKKNKIN
jgi:hypothetical protein